MQDPASIAPLFRARTASYHADLVGAPWLPEITLCFVTKGGEARPHGLPILLDNQPFSMATTPSTPDFERALTLLSSATPHSISKDKVSNILAVCH